MTANKPARAKEVCKAPTVVCAVQNSVFRISAFLPYGSAIRVAADLLVTNRHIVADEAKVQVYLPDGKVIEGATVPTSYGGDLILVRAALPEGPVAELARGDAGKKLYSVGYDLSSRAVRTYAPGKFLVPRAAAKPYARLHHTAYTQPGNSGGALVNESGELVGIAASGGENRYEAIPSDQIEILMARSGEDRASASEKIGNAYRLCSSSLDKASFMRGPLPELLLGEIATACRTSGNRQFMDMAAQTFGRARKFDQSEEFFMASLARDPNAVNTRLGLLVTLHFAGRYRNEIPHLRWLLDVIPADPMLLRFALQTAKWSGDQELAKTVIGLIETHDPRQLDAAKNFLERGPSSSPRGSF